MKNRAYISHLKDHQRSMETLGSSSSLRTIISERFGLSDCISFRKNTSLAVFDILDELLSFRGYPLVYSNIEHSCIIDLIESMVPQERRVKLDLYPELLSGRIHDLESKLVNAAIEPSVFFFSHVLWNCGISLDVENMAERIKKNNSEHIVIVDGAQAVGNLPKLFSQEFKMTCIDVYIGCTHKWVETKNLLGFISFNLKWVQRFPDCMQIIFKRDIFSRFAGEPKDCIVSWGSSTHDLIHLVELRDQLMEVVNQEIEKEAINLERFLSQLTAIPNLENVTHRFKGFYGRIDDLVTICDETNLSRMYIIEDRYLPAGYSWLRVEVK